MEKLHLFKVKKIAGNEEKHRENGKTRKKISNEIGNVLREWELYQTKVVFTPIFNCISYNWLYFV